MGLPAAASSTVQPSAVRGCAISSGAATPMSRNGGSPRPPCRSMVQSYGPTCASGPIAETSSSYPGAPRDGPTGSISRRRVAGCRPTLGGDPRETTAHLIPRKVADGPWCIVFPDGESAPEKGVPRVSDQKNADASQDPVSGLRAD